MYQILTTANKGLHFLFLGLFLISSKCIQAQNCPEIVDFETTHYTQLNAKYQWSDEGDANYYTLKIQINNQLYHFSELPANTTNFAIEFSPKLKHDDKVVAELTKYCTSGAKSTASNDFIVVTDVIVYLIGDPKNDGKIKVEPVYTLNDNLDPANNICGLCEPDFFRLTSGFYAPYGIAVSTATSLPMEQVRFDKSQLCGCLEGAIAAGIMDPNGGPGPQYTGTAYPCNITPYSFQKEDCERRGKERSEDAPLQKNSPTLQINPNPVVNNAIVDFTLQNAANVRVELYDVFGNPVKTLFTSDLTEAGAHQVSFQTNDLVSGVYYCTLRTAEQVETTKFIIAN